LNSYLTNDDIVVLNNTKVIPSRIIIPKPSNKTIELFILDNQVKIPTQDLRGRLIYCIASSSKIKVGDIYNLTVSGHNLSIIVIDKESNFYKIEFNAEVPVSLDTLASITHIPLPPYLKRNDEPSDKLRYQTEFAKNYGSVAAPTASLNFTNELKNKLTNSGIGIFEITLHCGYGTFSPIYSENVEDHKMHSEYFEIDKSLWETISKTDKSIVAVGTTVTRTLEYLYKQNPKNLVKTSTDKYCGEASIFFTPGSKFNIINKLITNFHAPRSTPLFLTCAFLAHKLNGNIELAKSVLLATYNYCQKNNFKFLSYGDSMLIL
jgi:S-adenosylmethionine:tRNA ribosyltransferase-isomerase